MHGGSCVHGLVDWDIGPRAFDGLIANEFLPIFNVLLLFLIVEVSVLEPFFAESFCFKFPIVGVAAQCAVTFEVLDGLGIVSVAVDGCFVDVVVGDLFPS